MGSSTFFTKAKGDHENADIIFNVNTDMWNNQEVYSMTGYSIEDIVDALYALAKFVSGNLVPNKLKYFDIEALKNIKNAIKTIQS